MRILFAFVALAVLGVTPAFADSVGCGGDDTTVGPPADMSIHDLSTPRHDMPWLDARRERRPRRRAAGAGLVVLAGLSASGVAVARRRGRA